MSKEIDDLIKDIMQNGKPKEEKLESKKQAIKILDDFLNQEYNYTVGDFVQRNQYGKYRYKSPQKHQVAKVIAMRERTYSDNVHEQEVGNDVTLACVLSKDEIRIFNVDGRFYEKASEESNVVNMISRFKKK